VVLALNFILLAGPPPHSKTVALVLLIAFFLLAIAAVPFEFNFYGGLKGQNLGPSVFAEISVFVAIVVLLTGAVLDWFTTPQHVLLMIGLVIVLLLLVIWFLYWRARLISTMLFKATRSVKGDLDKLLEEMRRLEESRNPPSGDKGAGEKKDE
jgi:O-antigen/teichoic acid export membrane protein